MLPLLLPLPAVAIDVAVAIAVVITAAALLPLLVDFCPSHHCRDHRLPLPSPPFLPLLPLVDCCLCPLCTPPLLSSLPVILIIADATSQNRSRRSGPHGLLGPPSRNPTCIDPREKTCGVLLLPPCKDRNSNNNIGRSRPWTPVPPPYPCVDSPPSQCPTIADADTATMMIPCLSIARPNTATTDGDPSEPHTDANAIVKGDAKMKTP